MDFRFLAALGMTGRRGWIIATIPFCLPLSAPAGERTLGNDSAGTFTHTVLCGGHDKGACDRPTQSGRRLRAIEGEGIGLLGVREAALADASGSVEEADGGEEHEQGADSGGQGYGAG